MKKQISWFSIIEVLVGILIFSLGLVGIFALISSSLRLNDYNKNYIIASNLAREQLELIKYIRDINYKTLHRWNQINPHLWTGNPNFYSNPDNFFQTGAYYRIENNISTGAVFWVNVQKIVNFWEGKSELNGRMQEYILCLNNEKIYTHTCSPDSEKTPFFRYIYLSPLTFSSGWVIVEENDSFKVTSKVIWYMRWYNEIEIDTILTDWKRL